MSCFPWSAVPGFRIVGVVRRLFVEVQLDIAGVARRPSAGRYRTTAVPVEESPAILRHRVVELGLRY